MAARLFHARGREWFTFVALVSVVAATLAFTLLRAQAAPVFSYFPTGSSTDGKMLCIAGDGFNTLSGTSVTVSFSVDDNESDFLIGFFDGAAASTWDMSTTNFPTEYTLYADPLGDGSGATEVASWTDADMSDDSWTDFPISTSAAAQAPSGNYFYHLTVNATNPSINSLNTFKVRVEGYTYIIPTTVFGYVGAYPTDPEIVYPDYPALTPTTYDGVWDFFMNVAEETTYIDLYDGDFDHASDTNDPNSSGVPWFDSGAAVNEGAYPGNPADDVSTSTYLRTPNIRYEVIDPQGTSYANNNASGNTEWERFRLDTTTNNPTVADHQPAQLPAGMYTVKVSGVDMHNLNALRFEHPIVGVDENGRPTPPPAPFLIGDVVWHDEDLDGVRDAGEPGLAGVVVTLCDSTSGAVLAASTTDENGTYSLNSWSGTFDVTVAAVNFEPGGALAGYGSTVPATTTRTVTVTDDNELDEDFGFYEQPLPEGVLVTPNQTGSMAPGQTIEYTFSVLNNTPTPGVFDLSTSTSMGWTTQIVDADGDPADSVYLDALESLTITVRVAVPGSATMGQQDVMRLLAELTTDPAVADSATGTTRVMEGLRIAADNESFGAPGSQVDYLHTVTNSWPETRTVSLSTGSSDWSANLYATDGVTPITQVTVGPFGASAQFLARVSIPAGAAPGDDDITTVTAVSGSASDSATDRTVARGLMTFSDDTCTIAEDAFPRGDTVYARATDLAPGSQVYFVWRDAENTVVRTAPRTTVSAQGMAFDEYATASDDPTGGWTVEVRDNAGQLLETTPFSVVFDAQITRLAATDAPVADTNVSITSTLANRATAPVLNSSATYVVWWDNDGDGAFGENDIYIDESGEPLLWDGSSDVMTHESTGIDVAGTSSFTDPPWTLSNSLFPYNGIYNVTATWTTSDGEVIDTMTSEFYSARTSDPGNVEVSPDQSATMAPGQTAEYTFTITNRTVAPGTFELITDSNQGWTHELVDLHGLPVSSTVLASWETTTVVLRVDVPPAATMGQQDTVVLEARLAGTPSVSDTAHAVTIVQRGIDITPDNTGYVGPGNAVYYPHTITNSYPTARDVTLSASGTTAGWAVAYFESDGVTPITGPVNVAENGGTYDVVVRITAPGTAAVGTVDNTTIRATAGTDTDTALDTTEVRRLVTYEDAAFTLPATVFVIGDRVYARATGLTYDDYYFRWYDENGTLVRQSGNMYTSGGVVSDSYLTTTSNPTGDWYVEVWRNRYTDVLIDTTWFEVGFDAGITALSATDASNIGDEVYVSSSTQNHIATAINDSTMTYVIWWDNDGDNVFGNADIYIDDTGSPIIWDGSSTVTPTHVTSGIDVAAGGTWSESTPWSIGNTDFPNQGMYKVTATWTDSRGTLIDEKTTEFYSIPTLGWPLFAVMLAGAAGVLVSRARTAGLMGGGERS